MIIKVKVFSGIKKEEVLEIAPDSFEVKVKPQPKQGRANARLVELLAEHFNLPERDVKIIAGFKTPSKTISIKN